MIGIISISIRWLRLLPRRNLCFGSFPRRKFFLKVSLCLLPARTVRICLRLLSVPLLAISGIMAHVSTNSAHDLRHVSARTALGSEDLGRHIRPCFSQRAVQNCELSQLVSFQVVLAHRQRNCFFNHLVGQADGLVDAGRGVGRYKHVKIVFWVRSVVQFSVFHRSFASDGQLSATVVLKLT